MDTDRKGAVVGTRHHIPSWAKKAALVLASSAVCLVVIEIAFRLAGYQAIYDVYSKPELFWRRDDLLGWSHEPNSKGVYVGPRPFPIEFSAPVEINSLGLRGPEIPDLPHGGYRVMVLGDSVVAGFEVPYEKTFTALLETQLTSDLGVPVQVINAGARGYGTDQSFLYYRERGRKLRPNLVMLVHGNNDPEDNTTLHRARRPFGKPAFALKADGSLELVGHPVPDYPFCSAYRTNSHFEVVRVDGPAPRAFCWMQTTLADHSALLTFVTMRIQQNPTLVKGIYDLGTPQRQVEASGSGLPATPAHALTRALILATANLVMTEGSPFILLAAKSDLEQLDRKAILHAGISVLDREALNAPPIADRIYKKDSHWNPLGHEVLSQHLAPVIAHHLRTSHSSRRAGDPTERRSFRLAE